MRAFLLRSLLVASSVGGLGCDANAGTGIDGGARVKGGGSCAEPAGFTGRDICPDDDQFGGIVATSGATSSQVSAVFISYKANLRAQCPLLVSAPCVVFMCPAPVSAADGGVAAATLGSGDITFSSVRATLTITPDAGGRYDDATFPGALWSPNTTLAFSSAGGTVPPFTATVCSAPPVEITNPAVTTAAPTPTIARGEDLTVTWRGTGLGVLEIDLGDGLGDGLGDATNPPGPVAQCFVAASASAVTVPREALMALAAGTHAIKILQIVRDVVIDGRTCLEATAATSVLDTTAVFQ